VSLAVLLHFKRKEKFPTQIPVFNSQARSLHHKQIQANFIIILSHIISVWIIGAGLLKLCIKI